MQIFIFSPMYAAKMENLSMQGEKFVERICVNHEL